MYVSASADIFSVPNDMQGCVLAHLEFAHVGRFCLASSGHYSQSEHILKKCFTSFQTMAKEEMEQYKDKPVVESMSSMFKEFSAKVPAIQTS